MTNEAKHTPGPWRVVHREGMARNQYGDHITADFYSIPGISSGRDAICDVKGDHRDANARLIAAAPALLAALRPFFDRFPRWAVYGVETGPKGRDHDAVVIVEAARAAIAQATGEEE